MTGPILHQIFLWKGRQSAVGGYKKKDMLQTVDTLLRANDAVVKTALSNLQGASEALAQCQESAIMLGSAIEDRGEKYIPIVQILEDYCENLYQMNENLSDENFRRKTAKKIQKQLTNLQNSIKYELPEDKREVVFLPYKASMWDSLESVWKAADEDPDCDAYVIPIPYFDKNPDGSFKEEHYEGDQYPKDVPVTRYDEYDLEARHPDVIYIHNPYDECNHVTSVHPYFYSKNIRNFTDKLVYIPYFILQEIEPDNQEAIDDMKHFCFTPGTIYAHRVIVQSEKMRQIYINEYIKAAKEMGLSGEHVDRQFLGEKFLGLGSPKLDKVANTKKEDLEIPAEWRKIIEKPDGNLKKIIFYNTSVSALLHNDEKMLKKMESVFGIFKENKDEVALLWRPHPLIQATIESMRPRLWEEYRKLRDRYIEEGWGIYDDSAELDRAIGVSDGYYGDWSSVVELCKKAGMSVVVQDVNIMEKNLFMYAANWTMEGCRAWFVENNQNLLFCANLETQEYELVAEMPGNGSDTYRMHPRCVKCGDEIFCMPDRGGEILVYQCGTYEFSEKIEIENPDKVRLCIEKFYLYGDTLFALSNGLKKLIKIDIKEKKVIEYLPFETDEKFPILTEAGTEICSYLNETRQLKCFDMATGETASYTLPNIGRKYISVCFDGEKFWFCGYRKEFYVWEKKKSTIAIISGFPKNFGIYNIENMESREAGNDILDCAAEEYSTRAFNFSLCLGESVWFIPGMGNNILYVDKDTQDIKTLEIGGESEDRDSALSREFMNGKYILEYTRNGRYIGIYSNKNRCILEIDTREKKVKRCDYRMGDTKVGKGKQVIVSRKTFYESEAFDLRSCIRKFFLKGAKDHKTEDAGRNIHKNV